MLKTNVDKTPLRVWKKRRVESKVWRQ